MSKSQQLLTHGSTVCSVFGSSQDVEYLCSMINTHEHCYVECFYSFGGNHFDIMCIRNNNLCRNVLQSFVGTPIMNYIQIKESL